MDPDRAARPLLSLAPLLLCGLLAVQVWAFIRSNANTFDEPPVIAAGYAYVRTGRLDIETRVHPPLMKYLFGACAALAAPDFRADSPDLLADRFYRFGHDFIFHNSASPERLLTLGRMPSLLLSLALAVCLWSWASRWFGPWGGALAMAAYALEPNILAHSGLANMDLGLTAFLFMAYFCLVRHLERPSPWRLAGAGLLAGCAMMVKIPGAVFFGWAALLLLLERERPASLLRQGSGLLLAAAAVVALCYQVRFLPRLGGLLAQMAPAIFVPGHPTEQHYNFLLGRLKEGGWWYYYLVALAVKTPLPFLLLCGLGTWKGLRPRERRTLAIPVLSYFLVCSFASKQNGLRYILPVFPFLCLAIGSLARRPEKAIRFAAPALLAWLGLESAGIAPNYLAYFNEAAGGPSNGYRVLVDSNLDWGQDMAVLKGFLRSQGDPEVIAACHGNGDLDHYLGPHQDLLVWESEAPDPSLYRHVNSSAPARELLVVSASLLQGFGLSDPQGFSWLKGRRPLAQPGYSSFVYDISSDALSHFNMGKIYLRNRRLALARRQFQRAADLDPAQPLAPLALGDVYRLQGDERRAAQAFRSAEKRAADPALLREIRGRRMIE